MEPNIEKDPEQIAKNKPYLARVILNGYTYVLKVIPIVNLPP